MKLEDKYELCKVCGGKKQTNWGTVKQDCVDCNAKGFVEKETHVEIEKIDKEISLESLVAQAGVEPELVKPAKDKTVKKSKA